MIGIYNRHTSPRFNLAAEEYLLKNFEEEVFMLWRSTPAVVLGKYQRTAAEVNLPYAKEHGIQITRRFSGGGTVYHDEGNLNFTFIRNGGLTATGEITAGITGFLVSLGIPAVADQRGGIFVEGLKISGSAQALHKNRVLHHATLLFNSNLNVLEAVLNPPREQLVQEKSDDRYFVPSVRSAVTNLQEYLPVFSVEQFAAKFFTCFTGLESFYSGYLFSPEDMRGIIALMSAKYASPEFIFQ